MKPGDKLYLNTTGYGTAKAYYVCDADFNLLTSYDDAEFSGIITITGENSKWLFVNRTLDNDFELYRMQSKVFLKGFILIML